MKFADWRGVYFAIPENIGPAFEMWMGAVIGDFQHKLWASVFYAIIWTIWDLRHTLVF